MGKKMSISKLVYLVFLFFCCVCSSVSSNFNSTLSVHKYKCSAQQSRALLFFKDSLFSFNTSINSLTYNTCQDWLGSSGYYPIMMNWNTSTDCCNWNGVTCDYFTGDIIGLDLSCGMIQGTIHPNTSLFNLPRLQKLNLAFNDFSNSQIPSEIGRFSNSLTHLNITECQFIGDVPMQITFLHKLVSLDLSSKIFYDFLILKPHVFIDLLRNSTSLEEISLRGVDISSTLPNHLNLSSSLKLLNLRETQMQGKLPHYIFNLPSMEVIDLYGNGFTGEIPWEISLLPKLVSLDLSANDNLRIQPHIFNNLLNNSTLLTDLSLGRVNISSALPTDLINISSSIKTLDLSYCSLMGPIPKSPLLNLTLVTYLDLSNNKLNGTLPSWLITLPYLELLNLSNNKFGGYVPFESFALPSLITLDLSFNNFSINSECELDKLLSSFTNLNYLDLSYSGLSITVDNATHYANQNQKLKILHLASCKINVFPESLRFLINLTSLDLSNNKINGDIPIWAGEIGVNNQLLMLNLSYNSITSIPKVQWYGLNDLYLQFNKIHGPFPPSICNMSYLLSLDLSNNKFSGVIPPCFGNFSPSLTVVDLSNNDFIGTISNTFEFCENLVGIILKGNQLQGELPTSLSKCYSLSVLDLENNNLNGTFPNWLEGLSRLQVLNLKSNNFHGQIVTSHVVEFPFQSLQVLDLSHNRFIGQLPAKYFQNLNAMKNVAKIGTKLEYVNLYGKYYSISVAVKGMEQDFPQIFVEYTIICLSYNNFEGKIPDIIGSLNSLIVLDLSHNNLTGHIPKDLGKLSQIESLDLSWNQLKGEIPRSLADLTFLSFLNVSQNHLVGRIPTGKQFNTLDWNSFEGNPDLCGLPLPKNCHENPQEPHLEGDEDEEENGFTWKVVMLGYGCGTLFGLMMSSLMLSTGRPKWFNAIADKGGHMILSKRKKRRYVTYIGR